MHFVHTVAMLAVVQYLVFAGMVGRARGMFGIKAPAITGDVRFERIYRVQMNTLELLLALLPALYVTASYWPPAVIAGTGAVYLIGRIVYWQEYVSGSPRRGLGYALSILPVFSLALAGLVPAVLHAIGSSGLLM